MIAVSASTLSGAFSPPTNDGSPHSTHYSVDHSTMPPYPRLAKRNRWIVWRTAVAGGECEFPSRPPKPRSNSPPPPATAIRTPVLRDPASFDPTPLRDRRLPDGLLWRPVPPPVHSTVPPIAVRDYRPGHDLVV